MVLCHKLENAHFSHIFFNMDIYVLLYLIWKEECLNILIRGLDFVLWYVECGRFKQNDMKSQVLPFLSENKNQLQNK